MTTLRLVRRSTRPAGLISSSRLFGTTCINSAEQTSTNPFAHLNSRGNDTAPEYRKFMLSKKLTPHMTNTTSTIANAFPSVGADKPPADQITSVDPKFVPTDSVPENTERMTGGTQKPSPGKGANAELDVGEIEGGVFKVEPHRRIGEDSRTLRARLLYQSRKRGTLESDLLLSHFAAAYLERMTPSQLAQYDVFLDENDWDIYYWATQEPPSQHSAGTSGLEAGRTNAEATGESTSPMRTAAQVEAQRDRSGPQSQSAPITGMKPVEPSKSEWAQTVGTFKPAYRPVPVRWRNSEILAMLRKHVLDNSAGGVHEEIEVGDGKLQGEGYENNEKAGGKGLGFMPELTPAT